MIVPEDMPIEDAIVIRVIEDKGSKIALTLLFVLALVLCFLP